MLGHGLHNWPAKGDNQATCPQSDGTAIYSYYDLLITYGITTPVRHSLWFSLETLSRLLLLSIVCLKISICKTHTRCHIAQATFCCMHVGT